MINVKAYPNLDEIMQIRSNSIPLNHPKYVIYFLFNYGILVYIGQTKKLLKRIGTHEETKAFNEIAIIETNVNDILEMELFYIEKYKPEYNMTIKEKSISRTKKTKSLLYNQN